ncbi:response regulator [Flavobacterium sp.]|uniref:response regulator n=1 Tax=Flavobacterium sp. TaxID=239 RepID=UPI002EDAAFA8
MPEPENSKKIICIADHDEDDRMLLHEALLTLNQPFEILEISTRDQLTDQLSKLSDIFPDFIFINTSMPGIEMVHCIETIRKETRSGMKVNIIIYSTDSERSSVEKAFEQGADFYAVKPSNYKDLKKLAGTVIEMEWETSEDGGRIFHIGF